MRLARFYGLTPGLSTALPGTEFILAMQGLSYRSRYVANRLRSVHQVEYNQALRIGFQGQPLGSGRCVQRFNRDCAVKIEDEDVPPRGEVVTLSRSKAAQLSQGQQGDPKPDTTQGRTANNPCDK